MRKIKITYAKQIISNKETHEKSIAHRFIHFFQDCLQACQEQIEKALAKNLPGNATEMDETPQTPPPAKFASPGQPTTPTDVRDVYVH